MAESIHPVAPHYLPPFIPGADGSDPLYTAIVVLIVILTMAVGIFYFKLHSLPERLAHRHNNTQLQLIAVLGVLALFTHNNVVWVLALLLAVVQLPDFTTPLNSIADSLQKLSSSSAAAGTADAARAATAEQSGQPADEEN